MARTLIQIDRDLDEAETKFLLFGAENDNLREEIALLRRRESEGDGIQFSGIVRGPTKIHATNANSDPTKRYVKVKAGGESLVVTELDVQPSLWGEDEMVYDKWNTAGDIVFPRMG